jgi:hypothetical protein
MVRRSLFRLEDRAGGRFSSLRPTFALFGASLGVKVKRRHKDGLGERLGASSRRVLQLLHASEVTPGGDRTHPPGVIQSMDGAEFSATSRGILFWWL